MEFIRQTVAWSNAVLTAMLPHFSDCAKQLNLPIPTPITTNMVVHFAPPVFTNDFQAALWLTNSYWFDYENGALSFRSGRDDLFAQQEITNLDRFVGKENMTTNEAIELARSSFAKLGYKLSDFGMDRPPDKMEAPKDWKRLGHMPFGQLTWRKPLKGNSAVYLLRFDIDMNKKRLVGMSLIGRALWRPPPKIDAVPELTNRPPPLHLPEQ